MIQDFDEKAKDLGQKIEDYQVQLDNEEKIQKEKYSLEIQAFKEAIRTLFKQKYYG